jgi:hypothetical protein
MEGNKKETFQWEVYYMVYNDYSYFTFLKTIDAENELDAENKVKSLNEGIYMFYSIIKKG